EAYAKRRPAGREPYPQQPCLVGDDWIGDVIVDGDLTAEDHEEIGLEGDERRKIALRHIDVFDDVAGCSQGARAAAQVLEAYVPNGLRDPVCHASPPEPRVARAALVVRICSRSFSAAAAVARGSVPDPIAIVSPIASVVMRIALFFPDTCANGSVA